MKNFSLGLSLLLGLGLSVVGCGDSGSGSSACSGGQVDCDGVCIDPIMPTLSAIQVDIFEGRGCASGSCHDNDLPQASLDLSSAAASEANLVGINSVQLTEMLRVAPSDSGSSYLMNKILGVDMALGTLRMPPNDQGIVLCEPEINAIRQWIDDGANAP
ncbi:MAG: hypothetical protein HKN10_03860 [Myxococcales bacterium]|nr:hypothetical protein [Myxococcales bacterium]